MKRCTVYRVPPTVLFTVGELGPESLVSMSRCCPRSMNEVIVNCLFKLMNLWILFAVIYYVILQSSFG